MAKRKKTPPRGVLGGPPTPTLPTRKLQDLFDAALTLRTKLNVIMGMIGDPAECVMRDDFPHHLRNLVGHTEGLVRQTSRVVRSMYTVREYADTIG